MSYAALSIEQRLGAADLALTNTAGDLQILALTTPFGYDGPKLREGRALYERALALHQAKRVERGQAYDATEALDAARLAARKVYMRHVRRARLAFEDEEAVLHQIAASGRRAQRLQDWINQARHFYTTLLADPAFMARMATRAVTQAELREGLALVEAVDTARKVREAEQGDAQVATHLRDEALTALDEFMSRFLAHAREALRDQPQLIEKLGVTVRA